ncbi:uncharacterized protein N7511_007385 [Penicillium nucicola]|uniref:uncharacterized protein n=1 Tax=Penicillium nucicola TaxID=1850975 RepID=UPI0025451AC5|nr:uncharacterized protein N7511_007385 [Penicillium nucicola]KAJ5757203.1 hypothetical protein N7511_007385 [Penicillium nucicola]
MASRKKQPKRDGIHFVNARPASEAEKLIAQRLVRAHVGRWISDQTKDRFEAAVRRPVRDSFSPLSANDPGVGPSSYALSRHAGNRNPPFSFARPPSPFPPSHNSDSSDSSSGEGTVSVISTEKLGVVRRRKRSSVAREISGVFDPFHTYPSPAHFDPEVVDLSERYITTVIWPGLAPRPNHIKAAGESWFPLSMADPALFSAFMFGSLCHLRVQWQNNWVPGTVFGPKQQQLLQQCEMESIKLINQAVRDPTRAVSDAVILSVICMAHHQAEEKSVYRHEKTAFIPPFPRLQWIDVYGCLPPNMIHIQGLIQLVKMRGGLRNLTTTGLAATVCFSAILTCSSLCVNPGSEFWPLDENRIGMSVHEVLGFTPSDTQHGFARLQGIGATYEMADAFQAVQTYIAIIKASPTSTPDVSLLADRRNITQHTLISLKPASELQSFFSHPNHASTYEACRLAALVFGVGVIFPIPAQNSPLHTLARSIQSVLLEASSSALWSSPLTRFALIWVLTLAGIAAHGAPERAWFVSALADITRRTGLSSWGSLKSVLGSMLWYDAACDLAAEALLLEGQRTYQQQHQHQRTDKIV